MPHSELGINIFDETQKSLGEAAGIVAKGTERPRQSLEKLVLVFMDAKLSKSPTYRLFRPLLGNGE